MGISARFSIALLSLLAFYSPYTKPGLFPGLLDVPLNINPSPVRTRNRKRTRAHRGRVYGTHTAHTRNRRATHTRAGQAGRRGARRRRGRRARLANGRHDAGHGRRSARGSARGCRGQDGAKPCVALTSNTTCSPESAEAIGATAHAECGALARESTRLSTGSVARDG
jgi:hypothetical protein